MEQSSGYKTITPIKITNVMYAWQQNAIGLSDVRVYFACYELMAVRETAQRCRTKRQEKGRDFNRYQISELQRLTALSISHVRRSLRRLGKVGVLSFNESEISPNQTALSGSELLLEKLACGRSGRRPIPMPRAVLRFLARNPTVALSKVMLGYALRGLSLAREGGAVSNKGRVKTSWLAASLGLSERAVRYAQAELRNIGWITKDSTSYQRVLNRHGTFFTINLAWSPVVKRNETALKIAPPMVENRGQLAPPKENKKTSFGSFNNQKTQRAEPRPNGFCKVGEEAKPSLRRIVLRDLHEPERLEALYFQAIEARWITSSEAMALNFIAAAVRAFQADGDPVKIFVGIVRRGLWQNITQTQEDKARQLLAAYREDCPTAFRVEQRLLLQAC